MPVIKLSDQKDIALEVKVTNMNGDDAHEASVVAYFSRSLTYSAVRVPPNVSLSFLPRSFPLLVGRVITTGVCLFQKQPVSCIANKNGSFADCDLGNPFKRNSEVRRRDAPSFTPSFTQSEPVSLFRQ